ncbi:MAG: hypothetical protein IKU10_03965 [Clostridia bacterium]|nr:hypothetical protein [Clostridia bacterium]
MNRLTKLFNNNRFLMVFSFVLAVAIWIVVSFVYSPQTGRTLAQIPIEITFPDESMGFKAYSKTELFANVDVSGKKYVVEQLSGDSLVVSASTEDISESGVYTLALKARKRTAGGDYNVVSVSPSTINVTVDKETQKELTVQIDCVGASVAELPSKNEKLMLAPFFADEANKVVTVTGPESEVQRISYVKAVAEVKKELSESETYSASLVAYDASGLVLYDGMSGLSTLQYTTFSYEKAEIIAGIELCKEVPLRFECVNEPQNAPNITLYEITGQDVDQKRETKTVNLIGSKNVIDKINEIQLEGVVDFSTIDPKNAESYQFKLTFPAINGVKYDGQSGMYILAVVEK